MIQIPDGLISLDSDFAAHYGFTSELFYPDTYLVGNSSLREVVIPMLISSFPGKGNFSRAVKRLIKDGIRVSIKTPVPGMQEILIAWKFEITWDAQEGVEYWIYPPREAQTI